MLMCGECKSWKVESAGCNEALLCQIPTNELALKQHHMGNEMIPVLKSVKIIIDNKASK